MASGTAYKQAKLTEAWDAIVVGSGIGGLTAATLLGYTQASACWCWKGTTRPEVSHIRFIGPATSGTWVCITSVRCRMSATLGAHSTTSRKAG